MGSEFGYGQFTPWDTTHELNVICAIVRTMLARLDTMKLVQVVAVHPGQGTPPAAGTVDVLPLVNQVDGAGNATKQGIVHGVPCWRLQGGTGAIVCDPAVNDIGYVVCADRDSSNVVRTKKQANPGSFRSFNIADGVYCGGLLNAVPTQWLRFIAAGGLELIDSLGNKIVYGSGGIDFTPASGQRVSIDGLAHVTGNAAFDANVSVAGALEGNTIQVTAGGTPITRILFGSVTTNFGGSIANFATGSQPFTVTGAKVGDTVSLGMTSPGAATLSYVAWVSAADTVTIRVYNGFNGVIPITSQTYTVTVIGIT